MPSLMPLLINSPLAFEYDQDTGLLAVVVTGEMQKQTAQMIEVPAFSMSIILYLTPEASRTLLSDLPKLEILLRQASKGPAKPDSVQ